MDYQKIYDNLVKKRLENPPTEKFERHHIVPRSLGGSDDKENIVKLTLREHYIAHLLLCRIHRGTRNYFPMLRALNMMRAGREGTYIKNSRMFEYFRADFIGAMSEAQSGERNSQFGKSWYYHPELKINKKFKPEEVPEGFIKGRKVERAILNNNSAYNIQKEKLELLDGSIRAEFSSDAQARKSTKQSKCRVCSHILEVASPSSICSFCRSINRGMLNLKNTLENNAKYQALFDEFVESGLSVYMFAKERGLYNSTLYRNWNRLGLIESNYNFILNKQ